MSIADIPRGRRAASLAATVVLTILVLAGCVESNYDLSSQAAPQLPWDSGIYLKDNGDEVTILRRTDDYHMADSENTADIKLFRWAGYPGYIYQVHNWNNPSVIGEFQYGFVQRQGESWKFYILPGKPLNDLPPRVAELAKEQNDRLVVINDSDTPEVLSIIAQNSSIFLEFESLTQKQ